ncbi:MAG: tol-pal system protein YbgF [Candidatus Manganitrophaceae bacterium]
MQSSVVDVEEDLNTIRRHQRELQGRLEKLEKTPPVSGAAATSSGKLPADLMVRVDNLGNELQSLTGRVDEENHLLSVLAKRTEDQSFRAEELLNRLDAMEARLQALEKGGTAREPEPSPEGKTILPGKLIDPKSKGASLTPTEAYNLAYNDYLKGNYDLAIAGFQGFAQQYPGSALIPQAIYWAGESHYNKRSYTKAIEQFELLLQQHPKSEKAPNALLKEGFAYLEMGDRVKGRLYLKKVIEQYPNSNESNLAKDKLSGLR